MKIDFLGGAGEVGASSVLLRIDNKNILFDSGIRQSASKDPLPDFRTIQQVGGLDAVIISHAHLDHIGSLPIISKEYPNARIYMNNMTKDLTKVLLHDSLKIMNNRESEIPLYAEQDVENMLNRIFTINYEVEFSIFDGMSICFYNAGHIAGASCIYLKSREGAFFYSGDFSVFSQKTVEGAKIPKLRPDVGVFECTYGDKLHSNREIEEKKLIDLVKECINNNGKMLIPAFALGRAQEIILILKKAMNKGEIKKINVFVDGMVKQINRVYKFNPLYLRNSLGKKILRGIEPFYDDNIKPIENKEQREKVFEENDSCIVISSSGMLTGGPSQSYAEKLASLENGYIVISGYQDEESPGRKLLNLLEADEKDRVIELNNKIMPVKCRVERVGLSAHGDKSEIRGLIDRLTPKNVFLVHGDKEIIQSFSSELAQDYRGRVYTPDSGENYDMQIRNPRKQLKKKFPFVLDAKESLNEENISLLWSFVVENYEDRLLNAEQLFYIWSGDENFNVENLQYIQKLIVNSIYFESDTRRLFLFKARNKQEVEEDLKPKELKPNEITELVKEYFGEYNYKKAGLKLENKKIILYFDFPKAVDQSIYSKIEKFKEDISWEISINEAFNNNAAELLIRDLFEGLNIKKISYQFSLNKIVVDIGKVNSKQNKFKEQKEKFKRITGIYLEIKNCENVKASDNTIIGDVDGVKTMEQNVALRCIDDYFRDEEFKPYKKSIKNVLSERYIELSFITPVIGQKYIDKLNDISKYIGWKLKISNSCNQNEIINLALRLCNKSGIELKKNPSFNPMTLEVTLKLFSDIDDGIFKSMKEEFDNKTGCKLKV
ncbi:MBL fold metallo-hydrolase [Haloimpatiens sp. FM7330]|uniref:MBL fold metallo-hydrolase n=1 Tax=Haloimpatiens sp. FM7330 TaxID=3298610 RepID=UPI00363AFD68